MANTTGKPIIDANALEAIAKERPNEKFLKGSGVLKLIQAIRDLERANRQLQAEQPIQIKNLRKALQFYADGHHFTKSDGDAWDTVSGEPQNYWCDEAGTATVEDGSIAKLALAGHPIKFEDEARRPAPSAAPNNPPMPEHWGVVVSVNGDNILCIGESYLHGKRELNEAEENAVIGVAQHLLAFVGYGLPPSSFDPDADDAALTAAQPVAPHEVATQPTAPSMTLPAERSLFKEQFRHLDLEEMPDAWGRPVFKHSHVDAIWHGWRQRAAIALLDTCTRSYSTAQATPAAPFNTETQDQIAAVMLQHGTEDQQRAALAYAREAPTTQAESVAAQCSYSIDTDPQGIRSRVAEAITGALAFGSQGKNPPPSGHWLAPFWNAARADHTQVGSALEDAARYRHLRDCNSGSLALMQITGTGEDDWHILTEDAADAAIDAARKHRGA